MSEKRNTSTDRAKDRASDESTEKSCFVISPIGGQGTDIRSRANDVRDFVIKAAVDPLGFTVKRADDIADPGMIMQQVVDAIIEADLVVADLTGLNPNVLYELAIRHETGKPVVMIADRATDVPFDINQARTIFFDHTQLRSVDSCKEEVRAQVEAARRSDYVPDNPIVNAKSMRAWRSTDSGASQRDLMIMSTLNDVSATVSKLDARMRLIENGMRGSRPIDEESPRRRTSNLHRRKLADLREQLDRLGISPSEVPEFDNAFRHAADGSTGAMDYLTSAVDNLTLEKLARLKSDAVKGADEDNGEFPGSYT